MATSHVTVRWKDGSPATGIRVRLGFTLGLTQDDFTDRYGVATIEHSTTGTATVYVRGDRCGTLRAPGSTSVTIG